jgi:hypothetical protein
MIAGYPTAIPACDVSYTKKASTGICYSVAMSWEHQLMLVSIAVSVLTTSLYVRSMFRGEAQPNLVSWGMWGTAPLIGASAALAAGADVWATLRIITSAICPLAVFLIAFFFTKSYWKASLFDYVCGACSVLALVVWLFVESPVTAVLIAALGDGAATLPTLIKAWKYPETEYGPSYVVGFLGALCSVPSIPSFTIVNSAFQIYMLCAGFLLTIAVYRKKILKRC